MLFVHAYQDSNDEIELSYLSFTKQCNQEIESHTCSREAQQGCPQEALLVCLELRDVDVLSSSTTIESRDDKNVNESILYE